MDQLDFIHPYDDEDVISGQGTMAMEILQQVDNNPDYIFVPVGQQERIYNQGYCQLVEESPLP